MKISIPKSKIFPTISLIKGMIPSSRMTMTIPSTAYLLFKVQGGSLFLTASSGTTEIVSQIEGFTADTEGEGLISFDKLLSISSKFGEDDVISFNCVDNKKNDKVEIKTEIEVLRNRFTLSSLSPDQFPLLEDPEGKKVAEFEVMSGDLNHLLEKVEFAMAHDDARYYLNGSLLKGIGESLCAVATDGHRLALCQIKYKNQTQTDINVILQSPVVQGLRQVLKQVDEMVTVVVDEDRVCFRFHSMAITVKPMEGSKFPDYERVIPTDFAYTIKMESEEFRQTMSKAQVVEGERTTRLQFSQNKMNVVCKSDLDKAEIEQEVQYDGKEVELAFNDKYLVDVLGAIDAETMVFEFKDSGSALQIREEGSETMKQIIMPLRV